MNLWYFTQWSVHCQCPKIFLIEKQLILIVCTMHFGRSKSSVCITILLYVCVYCRVLLAEACTAYTANQVFVIHCVLLAESCQNLRWPEITRVSQAAHCIAYTLHSKCTIFWTFNTRHMYTLQYRSSAIYWSSFWSGTLQRQSGTVNWNLDNGFALNLFQEKYWTAQNAFFFLHIRKKCQTLPLNWLVIGWSSFIQTRHLLEFCLL